MYRPGDRAAWAAIETSVAEFSTEAGALQYFDRVFLPEEPLMCQRCCFIVSPDGTPAATATAWYEQLGGTRRALFHWLAVCPRHQGMGLGRAVAAQALNTFARTEPGSDVWLHTQTWSHKAVGMYLRMGFHPLKTDPLNPGYDSFAPSLPVFRSVLPEKTWLQFLDMTEDR